MPSYTLSELLSFSTAFAGRRDDIDQSDVSYMVNMSYIEVADITKHKLTEKIAISSTTSGENRIDLPADYDSIINLSRLTSDQGSGKTLVRISASRADDTGFQPNGTPQRYVLFNDFLEIHPSPDSGYSLQLRYHSQITDMLALTDVPSLSTPWRKAILYKTIAEIYAFTENPEGEIIAASRYNNYVQQLREDEGKRQHDESGIRFSHSYKDVRQRSKRSFDVV